MAPSLSQIHLLQQQIAFPSRPLMPLLGCPWLQLTGCGCRAWGWGSGAHPWAGAAGAGLSALSQRLHFPCPPFTGWVA